MLAYKVLRNRNLDFFKNLFYVCALLLLYYLSPELIFLKIMFMYTIVLCINWFSIKAIKWEKAGAPAVVSDSGVRC